MFAARNKTRARIIQIVSLVVLGGASGVCFGDSSAIKPQRRAPDAEAAAVAAKRSRSKLLRSLNKTSRIQIKGIGNVEAVTTIAVRSQDRGNPAHRRLCARAGS